MKVPGTKIDRQVAIEVTQRGRLLKTHLKDGALDARTNDNMLPIIFKQVLDQGPHDLIGRLKVTQDSLRAIELCNCLLPQQFCWGSGGHGWLLLVLRTANAAPVWRGGN